MLNEILWLHSHNSCFQYLYGKYISTFQANLSGMFLKIQVLNPAGISGLES